jgi:hypothetical protein
LLSSYLIFFNSLGKYLKAHPDAYSDLELPSYHHHPQRLLEEMLPSYPEFDQHCLSTQTTEKNFWVATVLIFLSS